MYPSSPDSPTKRRRRSNSQELAKERGEQLSQKIREIACEFNLTLNSGAEHRLPSTAASPEKKCEDLIKFLYWHDRNGLDDCLSKFRSVDPAQEEKTASALGLLLKAHSLSVSNRPFATLTSFSRSFPNDAHAAILPETAEKSATTSFTSTTSYSHLASSSADPNRSFTSATASSLPTTSAQTSFTTISSIDDDPFVSHKNQNLAETKETKPAISKGLEHYHVRNLPTRGFFVKSLPSPLLRAPEHVRYECLRLSQSYNLDIYELATLFTDEWADYETLWSIVSKLIPADAVPKPVSKGAWDAARAASGSPNLLRTARFHFLKESDRDLFRLSLEPLRELPGGRTCRLFRHFGSHRFLKLEIPSTRALPGYLKDQESNIRTRIEEWSVGPAKELLGSHWKMFFVRPNKTTKTSKDKKTPKVIGYEAFFFAESGPSLVSMSIGEILGWFMPFENNTNLSLQKCFSRIELGLSKTYATCVFKPSQVRWIPDILADGTLSSNDLGQEKHSPLNPCIMNDGCSRISIAAAKLIWAELKQSGPCPSAFQARIGPWKGVWMIDVSQGYSSPDIWIEVTPSQRKFLPHQEDQSDNTFHPDRLTFEVLNWSSKATKSSLYREYLPILEQRDVPRSVLSSFVAKMLDAQTTDFFNAFSTSATLYKWIEERFSVASGEYDNDNDHGRYCGAMPLQVGPRLLMLLAAGFELESEHVTNHVKVLAKSYFKRVCCELDIPLSRSTYVYGVADPERCLKPDEIHLAFSRQFGEEPCPFLDNVDALVARHPALKQSDIQKVKVVYKEELRHLLDIVIFPTQGCFPLAGKLQGGDYDGDRFWVCWEPDIVRPFRNAPPSRADVPESFGIEVDRTKVGEIFTAENTSMDDLSRKGLKATYQPQQLGVVTLFHQKLTYFQNSIATEAAEQLVNLHDFLVDSSKNGYSFSLAAWKTFQKSLGIDLQAVEKTSPAFATVTQSTLFDPAIDWTHSHDRKNIIDDMIFNVARSRTLDILKQIDSLRAESVPLNEVVSQIYLTERDSDDPNIQAALREMEHAFKTLHADRRRKRAYMMSERDNKSPEERTRRLNKATNDAYRAYQALRPAGVPNWWLRKSTLGQPCHWDLVKASAIFTLYASNLEFAFDCAGRDLCYIKAHSRDRPSVMVPAIYSRLKMKKAKILAGTEELFGTTQPAGDDPAVISAVEHGHESDDTEEDEDTDDIFDEYLKSVSQSLEHSTLDSPKKRRLALDA